MVSRLHLLRQFLAETLSLFAPQLMASEQITPWRAMPTLVISIYFHLIAPTTFSPLPFALSLIAGMILYEKVH